MAHYLQRMTQSHTARTLNIAAFSLAGMASIATAGGPCQSDWDPTLGQPGMDGTFPYVYAIAVYNGDLYAGGQFESADGQTVSRITRWDGSMWQPLVSGGEIGVDGDRVEALTIYNNELIVGGFFTGAGGQQVSGIARWDGSEWDAFDAKIEPGITTLALTVYDGDLIAGGSFIAANGGGQTFNYIARWDGTQWHPFVSGGEIGVGGGFVESLAVYNGDLYVGGDFVTAGGQTVNGIARWDGTQWHPLASGGEIGVNHPQSDGEVDDGMEVYNGDLYVLGSFITAGGQEVNNIARWDGSQWHPLISGGETGVTDSSALTVYNGELIVSGPNIVGGQTVNEMARWDGTQWSAFPSCGGPIGVSGGAYSVNAMTEYNGQLIAGGQFTLAGGYEANRIAAWNGCPFRGACCINGTAVQLYEAECLAAGGVFYGEEVPSNEVMCGKTCAADINGDNEVNVSDLFELLAAWGACP